MVVNIQFLLIYYFMKMSNIKVSNIICLCFLRILVKILEISYKCLEESIFLLRYFNCDYQRMFVSIDNENLQHNNVFRSFKNLFTL